MGRRRVIAGVVAIVAANAGVTVAVAHGGHDAGGGVRTEWRKRPWQIAAISADQRELVLVYASGGCSGDRGRIEAIETPLFVRLRVESSEVVDGDIVCTLDRRTGVARVRLREPLRGRRLVGGTRVEAGYGRTRHRKGRAFLEVQVPRVRGLRAADAADVLDLRRFAVRTPPANQRRRPALGTSPAQGAWLPFERRPASIRVIVE